MSEERIKELKEAPEDNDCTRGCAHCRIQDEQIILAKCNVKESEILKELLPIAPDIVKEWINQ